MLNTGGVTPPREQGRVVALRPRTEEDGEQRATAGAREGGGAGEGEGDRRAWPSRGPPRSSMGEQERRGGRGGGEAAAGIGGGGRRLRTGDAAGAWPTCL